MVLDIGAITMEWTYLARSKEVSLHRAQPLPDHLC